MFRIRIHLIRIWIQHFRLITYPDPGFWWPNIFKSLQLKKYIFWIKTTIYLSLGLQIGRQSYIRSLQPSKKNILHLKTRISYIILNLWGIFALLDPDPHPDSKSGSRYGSTDLIESGSDTLPAMNITSYFLPLTFSGGRNKNPGQNSELEFSVGLPLLWSSILHGLSTILKY